MKAVRLHRLGPPEEALRVDDVERPVPQAGQVLVKLSAAGVNFADVGRRLGIYPVPEFPAMMGLEGAGVVEAVGPGVRSFSAGDRFLAMAVPYSYSEYTVAPETATYRLPDGMSMEDGAAIGVVFLTSWHCLVTAAQAKAGESVLVHAAGSGCGTAAIQIAKHLGLRVLTTASSPEKLEKARSLGADDLIDYSSTDFVEEVQQLTGGEGVDIVLDGVGGSTLVRSLACLRRGGRLITYGKAAGNEPAELDPAALWGKQLSITGVSVGSGDRSVFNDVLKLFASGDLRPIVDKVFPFDLAGEAHRFLEDRRVFGKVVLTIP
jgi:NADPH2:quinone reductase